MRHFAGVVLEEGARVRWEIGLAGLDGAEEGVEVAGFPHFPTTTSHLAPICPVSDESRCRFSLSLGQRRGPVHHLAFRC